MSFKTKADVDRHAEDIFRKCTSDHDRKLKSLSVGKLYLSIKAYDSAIRYFHAFLSVNENSPETYKLLGKCFQQSGKIERAIASYKRSLELEPPQPNLILLICELMSQMNLAEVGISAARHWCEKGSDLFPNNPVVNSLKQKIIVAEDKDPRALEQFYLTELRSNPNDENILINLLNLYVDTKQYATAHNKLLEYQGYPSFHQSLEWHRCLSKVYKFCLKEPLSSGDQADYLLEAVSVSDNYLSILHRARNDGFVDETTSTLRSFDELLWKLCSVPGPRNPIDKDIQKHYLAQLAYHISVLLLKKLVQENISKDEAIKLLGPSLLFSQASPFDLESPHLSSLQSKYRVKMKYLVDDAVFRVVQANLTLRNWSSDTSENQLISNITNSYSKETRDLIFSKILKRDDVEFSCWLASSFFDKLPSRLLSMSEIVTESNLFSYERRSCSSYHDLVWLGVQLLLLDVSGKPRFLPQIFNCQISPSRSASPQNLSSVSIETLSKLDVDSFLYLSVFSCYLQFLENKNMIWHRFSLADAMPLLTTEKQLKFWTAAKKSWKKELVNEALDLKSILVKGIETVRLIGHHGLDLKLLIHVARTFENHARSAAKGTDALHTSAVENRASLFWRNVVHKLDLLQNHNVYESSNSFFPFKSESPIRKKEVIDRIREEGRFFIGYKMMRNEDYHSAIDVFKSLRSSDAALNEALIYKRLALNEIKDHEADEITSDMRMKHNMWLMKAKETLKVVEERIGGNANHPLRAELETQMEDIEGRLVHYDRDFGDGVGSDSLPSSIDSNDEVESSSICLPQSSYNSLSHNLDLRLKPKESVYQRSPRVHTGNYSLKEIIASHSRTLKVVEQLAKKVVQIELDVGQLGKNVKKTERNLERILMYLRCNPNANPVFQNMPMGNLMFPPHMMPNPSFYPPNIPDLRFQSVPPILPPFIAPGMPFLQPGLPLMPPMPLPGQAQHFGLFQAQPRPSLEVSQLNLSTSLLPQQPSPNLFRSSDLPHNVQNHTYTVVQDGKNAQSSSVSVVSQPFSKSDSAPVCGSQVLLSYTSPSSSFSLQQPVMTQTPLFKPSSLNLPVSSTPVTSQPVVTPSKQVASSLPSTFTPNAMSTPPRGQIPFLRPAMVTPSAQSTPVQTTNQMTPVFNTKPIVSTPQTSQDGNRSKVSEPLFSLLTTPSASAKSAGKSTSTPVTTVFNLPSQTTPLNASRPTLAIEIQSSLQVSTSKSSIECKPNQAPSISVFSKSDNTPKSLLKATLLKSVDASVSSPFSGAAIVSLSSTSSSAESSPLSTNTTLDFANLAKNSGETSFRKSDSFKGFEGQGSKLFDSSSSSLKTADSSTPASKDGESAEDFVPTAEFQPLIALPEIVEVKTGEEGLTVLYEERCKLLRYDSDAKEWKERGLGKMKILHDPVKGTVRLLMRREQVHKVCCNQNLTKDLALKPLTSSDKAWTWYAPDFSEGEQVMETFALRFKNSNLAQAFFAAVEDAKQMIGNKLADYTSVSPKTDKLIDNKSEIAPLSELFKPAAGSWECTSCYTRNSQEKSKCLACEAPNLNQPEPVKAPVQKLSLGPSIIQLGANTSSFSFGIPQPASKNTSDSNQSNNVMQKSSFGLNKSEQGSNATNFTFGIPQSSSKPETISANNVVNGSSKPSTADSLSKSIFSFKLASDNNTIQKSEASQVDKTSFMFPKSVESNSMIAPQKSKASEVSKTSFMPTKPAESNSQKSEASNFSFEKPPEPITCQFKQLTIPKPVESDLQNESQKSEWTVGSKSGYTFGTLAEPTMQKNENQPFLSSNAKTVNGSEIPKSSFAFSFTNGTGGIFNGGSSTLSNQNNAEQTKSMPDNVTTRESGMDSGPGFAFGPNARKSLGLKLDNSKNSGFSVGQQGSGDETLVSDEISVGDETLLADQGNENEDTLNDSEDNIHFEPVIPLPPEIVPTTGEEDETVLYCHLAKLFRYRDGEWKERGVGDIKILKHKAKGDVRFVMRRNPIDVVCLNHLVTKDIEITPKDAKSWTWSALDFSDGIDRDISEMKPDVFSLRFKNAEIASEFKAAVDSALKSKSMNGAVLKNGKGQ